MQGLYLKLIAPFFALSCSIMLVEFGDLNKKPQETVTQVLQFIGADPTYKRYTFSALPVSVGERKGRRMHPAVRRKLQHFFAVPNQKLFAMVGKEYPWGEWDAGDEEEGGGVNPGAAVVPVLRAGQKKHVAVPIRKDSGLVKRVVSITARV